MQQEVQDLNTAFNTQRKAERQGGCCAICGGTFQWGRKQSCPHVDHNHKTGAVRALLCNRCNSVIGLTGESLTILKEMEQYLCHGYSAKR